MDALLINIKCRVGIESLFTLRDDTPRLDHKKRIS